MKGFFGEHPKLTVTLVLLLVIGLAWSFDYYRSQMYHIAVEEVTPSPVPMDGQTETKISVSLRDSDGSPVEGHILYIVRYGVGSFKYDRKATDENGQVDFYYYPVKASVLSPVADVPMEILDESNSVIIQIPARTAFTVETTEPGENAKKSVLDMSSVYGD